MKPETLSNGMRAILVPSTENSIVAVTLFFNLPGAVERPKEAGIVSFTHKLLMRGTRKRNSRELAEAVEKLGTSMACEATDDFSCAHFVSTNDTIEESMELLAEVVQNPSFEPEEIEKERQSTIAAIRRSDDDKFNFTYKRFLREVYGKHSYGSPRMGTEETVAEFRREQMVSIHNEFFDPSRFLAVCVGNFDSDQLKELLERNFSETSHSGEPFVIQQPLPVVPQTTQFSKECEQAFLCLGVQTCSVTSRDVPAMRVLNAILGEGMSSRLFVKLRDEQGLAYATGSSHSPKGGGGHLVGYIGTKPESLNTAREGMLREFQRIRDEMVPDEELRRAKNYVVGKFLIDHQTNYRRAWYLGSFEMLGLGYDMDEKYSNLVLAVTADEIQRVAQKYLHDYTTVELLPEQPVSP